MNILPSAVMRKLALPTEMESFSPAVIDIVLPTLVIWLKPTMVAMTVLHIEVVGQADVFHAAHADVLHVGHADGFRFHPRNMGRPVLADLVLAVLAYRLGTVAADADGFVVVDRLGTVVVDGDGLVVVDRLGAIVPDVGGLVVIDALAAIVADPFILVVLDLGQLVPFGVQPQLFLALHIFEAQRIGVVVAALGR